MKTSTKKGVEPMMTTRKLRGRLAGLTAGFLIATAVVLLSPEVPAGATTPVSSVFAGGGANPPGMMPQSATGISLNSPSGLAVDSSGNVYIADTSNNRLEKVTPQGQLVVFAGGGTNAPSTTAQDATTVSITSPTGVAVDSADNVYVIDNGSLVEKVTPAGQLSVVVGGGTDPWWAHGPVTQMGLSIGSIAVDGPGNIYVNMGFILDIAIDGSSPPVAGGGSDPLSTDWHGGLSTNIGGVTSMAADGSGNIYFSSGNSIVKESSGQVAIIAGTGANAPSTTPQTAVSVALSSPSGLTVDGSGTVYFVSAGNIGKITTDGQLSLVAAGVSSTSPAGLAVDAAGNIFTLSAGNTVSKIPAPRTPQATLSISNSSRLGEVGTSITLTTTGGSGTIAPTFAVTGDSCSLDGSSLSASKRTTCSVVATNPANGIYQDATSTSVIFQFVRQGAPSAPRSLTATTSGKTITITWSAPASAGGSAIVSYRVHIVGGESRLVDASATSYVFRGLSRSAHYEIGVAAVNSDGKGPWVIRRNVRG